MASKRWLITTGLTILLVWSCWALFAPTPMAMMTRHWAVGLTMAFGSMIAGATCEGGGAVAFPVFTKVLHIAPEEAKWFTFAIQSIGMTAASITIVAMRRVIDRRALLRAGLGGAVGVVVGLMFLAPFMQPRVVRVLFTMMQCAFAVTLLLSHWMRTKSRRGAAARLDVRGSWILVLTGFVGGLVSALFGHGLDLVTFSVLVLLFRVDERVATPTTVVLMASNSLVGFATGWWGSQYSPIVIQYWLAAIPIVVVGAPLGAIICKWLSRTAIVRLLVTLIAIEFATTLWLIPMTPQLTVVALVALSVFAAGFIGMSRCQRFWPEHKRRIKYSNAALAARASN